MNPTIGRLLHYRLSAADVEQINRRRTDGQSIAQRLKEKLWPARAQAHIGYPAVAGDVVPLLAVRVAFDGGSEEATVVRVSGQAFLNGNDVLWVKNAREGDELGQWFWPPRS